MPPVATALSRSGKQNISAAEWEQRVNLAACYRLVEQFGWTDLIFTHPAGQTLIVTSGAGWVQQWEGERREIKPGDVVWIPPGVKHWHGATATNAMRHLAIQEFVGGKNVDWMEKVTDEQYQSK